MCVRVCVHALTAVSHCADTDMMPSLQENMLSVMGSPCSLVLILEWWLHSIWFPRAWVIRSITNLKCHPDSKLAVRLSMLAEIPMFRTSPLSSWAEHHPLGMVHFESWQGCHLGSWGYSGGEKNPCPTKRKRHHNYKTLWNPLPLTLELKFSRKNCTCTWLRDALVTGALEMPPHCSSSSFFLGGGIRKHNLEQHFLIFLIIRIKANKCLALKERWKQDKGKQRVRSRGEGLIKQSFLPSWSIW